MTIYLLSLFLYSKAEAVTEFVVTINKADEDYNTGTLAEAALDDAGDLTNGTVATGNWDAQSGTIADGANVTWNSGVDDGTLIHMTDAGATGTYLVKGDDAGDITNLEDNDIIDDGGGNTITVDDTPDSATLVLEFYDDQNALTESPQFTINGLTTDATHFMKLTCPVGERHSGIESDGSSGNGFLMIGSGAKNIFISDNYVAIEWFQVVGDGSGDEAMIHGQSGGTGAAASQIRNSIFRDMVSTRACIRTFSGTEFDVYNCIIYNIAGAGGDAVEGGSGVNDMDCFNVTVFNIGKDGFTGSQTVAINSAAFDCAENCFDAAVGASTSYNISSDDTATDEDPVNSLGSKSASNNFVSVSGGSENFHLKTGADMIDVGLDLGAGSAAIDIDGRDRDAEGDVWDMGADEFVAVAVAGQVIIIS